MRRLLNTRLSPFGEIVDLSLDTARRRVQFRFELWGERTPIDLDVRRYDIERGEEGDWLTVVDAVASRQWLTVALREFAVGRRFPVSPKTAAVLRLLA